MRTRVLCVIGAAVVAAAPVRADRFPYLLRASTWRYFRGLEPPSSPDPERWHEPGFEDAGWTEAAAPFGYGDNTTYGTDLSTLTPPMRSTYTTLFLRRAFEVADPATIVEFYADVDYDDGFVMWINGEEVVRENAAGRSGDPVAYDATASSSHESGRYQAFELPDAGRYLVAGTNVVAVVVLNRSLTSSDLKFDLELYDPVGPDVTPPVVTVLAPPGGVTLRHLTEVEVTFSEAVAGLDAGDLLVNGVPAAGLTGFGPGPYRFTFDPPPAGTVTFSWAADHGITDRASPANAFEGGSWSLTVDPAAPVGDLVITEFLAVNGAGRKDEDGDEEDWIEIYNQGGEAADLAGWSLTDDRDDPSQWIFPSRTLGPGEYLVVFASGKDRKPPSGNLHTNFKLNVQGEYLALYGPEIPRRAVTLFDPRFPPQRVDRSYGIDAMGRRGYFETPTPGRANGAAVDFQGFVADPAISVPHGFYDEAFDVVISSRTPGATVYYTLNGSEPGPGRGTAYEGPVRIEGTPRRAVVTLRAAAYRDGYLPSNVVTRTYIFPAHVLDQPPDPAGFPSSWPGRTADYALDPRVTRSARYEDRARAGLLSIPTLSIVMEMNDLFGSSRGIYANPSREGIDWERPASAELVLPDGRPGFQVDCGMRVQGGSSTRNWKSVKVSLRLLFKSDYGPSKLRYPLFPDSAVDRFDTLVLDAHLNQTWTHPSDGQRRRALYVRDTFVSDLQNAERSLAPHDIFVNLYLNGLHWGVYDVHERPDDSFSAEYLGGEKREYDVLRHNSSTIVAGNRAAWDEMFRRARADVSTQAGYESLAEYLDIPDLADYMLVHFWAGDDDWPHHNWYTSRRRAPDGRFRVFSWDSEHVLKDVNINMTGVSNNGTPAELYARLRSNPEFRLLFADRVNRHFSPGGPFYVDPDAPDWDPDHPERNVPASLFMLRIDEIYPAVVLESARWGDARRSTPYTVDSEWQRELDWLQSTYFPNRSARVLAQLRSAGLYPNVGAPVFSQQGGIIDPGTELVMSLPSGTSGTIYYTLDGSDPRVPWTGEIAPSARAYDGPIGLWAYAPVKARTRSGSTWSALTEAIFRFRDAIGALRATEIMYHPAAAPEYEFLELQNRGDATIGLGGLYFSNGIRYAFGPEDALEPGGIVVLAANPAALEAVYPGLFVWGAYEGSLANGGEEVTLEDAQGGTVFSVRYDDEGLWPIGPDGFGYSLVVLDPAGDPDDPANWRPSAEVGGSPGAEDPPPPAGGVVINEILARASPPLEGAVELYNPTGGAIAIGGWYLSDSRADEASLKRFRIPDGTVIAAGGHAVFYEGAFGGEGGLALDPRGGAVYLAAADGTGALTGHVVGMEYPASAQGVSFGRYAGSDGIHLTALEARTFGVDDPGSVEAFRTGTGAPNALPAVGPIVINEIMYHPAPDEEEFIELFNLTPDPILLFDASLGRGWRIEGIFRSDATDAFAFEADAVIPADGYLLVVGIDPEAFRELHAVLPDVPIVGPYGGALDNGGEWITLSRPEDLGGGDVVHVPVDRIRYNDRDPWPIGPDGDGSSLERILAWEFGDDPANWAASTEVRGTPGGLNSVSPRGGNRPPTASFHASPERGTAPLHVTFDASRATDPDGTIIRYAWAFGDGATDVGAIAIHTFTDPGTYTVTLRVTDDDGATGDAVGSITVEEGPEGGLQLPSDVNQDGRLDIGDAIGILGFLFQGDPATLPCGDGTLASPGNTMLLDGNGDGRLDLGDAVHLLAYLFVSGPPPALGETCVPIPGCPDVCVP